MRFSFRALAAAVVVVAGSCATPAFAAGDPAAGRADGFCRALVGDRSKEAAARVRILYGGSMKPDNAGELLALEDCDGGLIGGASLEPASFQAIIDLAG